jgi:hypothetical protein
MFLDTRNKRFNMHGLRVGISMLFDTRNKNIYGLGVRISIVFKIFSNSCLWKVGMTPGVISNVLHILPVTQGTRIYI